jgi:hypothetical protein
MKRDSFKRHMREMHEQMKDNSENDVYSKSEPLANEAACGKLILEKIETQKVLSTSKNEAMCKPTLVENSLEKHGVKRNHSALRGDVSKNTSSLINKDLLVKKILKKDKEYNEKLEIGKIISEAVREYDINTKSLDTPMREWIFIMHN